MEKWRRKAEGDAVCVCVCAMACSPEIGGKKMRELNMKQLLCFAANNRKTLLCTRFRELYQARGGEGRKMELVKNHDGSKRRWVEMVGEGGTVQVVK